MKVDLYGVDHSPWVQAVLLGLHQKKVEYSLRSLPPLAAFRKWGVLMPAVSINGGPWEIESSKILVKLGFDPISEEDLEAIESTWQGVLHRLDNFPQFFRAFSLVNHRSTTGFRRSLVSFFFSFTAVYMFLLINFAKLTIQKKEPEDFGEQYLPWESALADSDRPFFDGDTAGARDLMLFAIIQCHSSIPVPPLESLQSDERLGRLRAWIAAMHQLFEDYPHLYSGGFFSPKRPQPVAAGRAQQIPFWLGLVSMWLAFPITLPLAFFLMTRVPR